MSNEKKPQKHQENGYTCKTSKRAKGGLDRVPSSMSEAVSVNIDKPMREEPHKKSLLHKEETLNLLYERVIELEVNFKKLDVDMSVAYKRINILKDDNGDLERTCSKLRSEVRKLKRDNRVRNNSTEAPRESYFDNMLSRPRRGISSVRSDEFYREPCDQDVYERRAERNLEEDRYNYSPEPAMMDYAAKTPRRAAKTPRRREALGYEYTDSDHEPKGGRNVERSTRSIEREIDANNDRYRVLLAMLPRR